MNSLHYGVQLTIDKRHQHHRVSGELTPTIAEGNYYEDVFVFEDLVYAMECRLRVVHVYRNRNNSLIQLYDVRITYPCECDASVFDHSIIVTKHHIIQCCADDDKPVSIQDRYGILLQKIRTADISGHRPFLCQVDFEGNILMADLYANRLLVAHADQPSSQWRVANLPDLPDSGCWGAVWFRHRLHVASRGNRKLTFTPVNAQMS